LLAPIISPRFSKICTWPTSGARAELEVLLGPEIDDPADGRDVHVGERQVVSRREAEHAAVPVLGAGDEEAVDVQRRRTAGTAAD
jgi:hypothetical protein